VAKFDYLASSIQVRNEHCASGRSKISNNGSRLLFTQICMMNRKPEWKAELPHSALYEQLRFGLVDNPGYLDKILDLHWNVVSG
jgi:hypothetical protein